MGGLLTLLSLCAAPAEPLVLANPGFVAEGFEPSQVTYLTEYFGNQLRVQGIKVIATPEGAEGVVAATLQRFGRGGTRLDVRLTLTGKDEPLAVRSLIAQNDSELYELLRRTAQELAAELFHQLGKMPVPQTQVDLPPPPQASGRSAVPGYIAIGVGLVAAAGGGALIGVARNQLSGVRAGNPDTYAQAQSQAEAAKTFSQVGVILAAAGAAVAVAGIGYAVMVSRGESTSLAVAPYAGAGQGGLVVSGSFP